jgi:predicted outer membrane lipoprotein
MKNRKGLTMVECMMLAALIGIIAAVALESTRDRSNDPMNYKYTTPAGDVVKCRNFHSSKHGNTLSGCDNGKEYRNVTNVEVL